MGKNLKPAFTLIEIVLAIAVLAILSAATISAVNPALRLSQARNLERSSHVAQILAGVKGYASEQGQQLSDLGSIPTCPSTATIGTAGINLGATLVDEYITQMPTDPTTGNLANTGYTICRTASGRVEVSAPNAELGENISLRS